MIARTNLSKLARVASQLQAGNSTRTITATRILSTARPFLPQVAPATVSGVRSFSDSLPTKKNITPDSGEVEFKETPKPIQTPAKLTDSEYHTVADEYLERLLYHLEELAEQRTDVEVEYSAGVMSVTFRKEGTYVINKQPPNKQIWLSSPKSGPKRYDYVILGDGFQDKQDTAAGDWVYLRDGSTLSQLFSDEMGVNTRMPIGHYDGEADLSKWRGH
ncbi:Frataxin-like domain-containing protein [Podospora australis]|uniref:ferroxidase n=1 Tax=Podospora australis TaxID=1536484 RepID=A0AAN7AHT7_9PEZI|nr:Frataxin-like domain-containing protein [Podospora australis]